MMERKWHFQNYFFILSVLHCSVLVVTYALCREILFPHCFPRQTMTVSLSTSVPDNVGLAETAKTEYISNSYTRYSDQIYKSQVHVCWWQDYRRPWGAKGIGINYFDNIVQQFNYNIWSSDLREREIPTRREFPEIILRIHRSLINIIIKLRY